MGGMGNNIKQASNFFFCRPRQHGMNLAVNMVGLFVLRSSVEFVDLKLFHHHRNQLLCNVKNIDRFNPVKILGGGTYMLLRPSKVLPRGGNNQVQYSTVGFVVLCGVKCDMIRLDAGKGKTCSKGGEFPGVARLLSSMLAVDDLVVVCFPPSARRSHDVSICLSAINSAAPCFRPSVPPSPLPGSTGECLYLFVRSLPSNSLISSPVLPSKYPPVHVVLPVVNLLNFCLRLGLGHTGTGSDRCHPSGSVDSHKGAAGEDG